MEILQHTIRKIDTSSLNTFQLEIWNILILLFEKLKFEELSDKSIIDEIPYVDIILRLKENDFVLNLSIRRDVLVINSNYFDVNVYPETSLDKVRILLKEIISGKYSVFFSYGKKESLILKELLFDNYEIKEFNQKHKMNLFNKKTITTKTIKGYELMD